MNAIPISDDQLARLQSAQLIEEADEKAQIEEIKNFDPISIYKYLEETLIATEVVLDAYSLIGLKTEISSVNFVCLTKLRTAVFASMIWLESRYPEVLSEDSKIVKKTHQTSFVTKSDQETKEDEEL